MGQPMAQLPTMCWGPWGPPPLWPSFNPNSHGYYNNWQQPGQQQASHQATALRVPSAPSPPTAVYQDLSDNASSNGSPAKEDAVTEPLVNALAVSSVPVMRGQHYLSLDIANSVKKCIWASQFIALAYLLETQPVPEDSKLCSNSTNPDKLSLTSSKPRGKVDSYAAWNKGFRVYIEIVALK